MLKLLVPPVEEHWSVDWVVAPWFGKEESPVDC